MRGRPDRQTDRHRLRNRKIERARQTGTEKLREADRQTETIRQTGTEKLKEEERQTETIRHAGTEKLREAERQTETIRQTDVIVISSTPAVNSEPGCKFCQYQGGTTADTIPMTSQAVR